MPDFHRKPNRLPRPCYGGPRSYFVTICTQRRAKLFTEAALVESCLGVLREAGHRHSFGIYAYCFMPDHLHLALVASAENADLPTLVRAFKGRAASRARSLGISRLWQKGYYDHILRAAERLDCVAWYIFENPVRAGLVDDVQEWAFSGSFMFPWERLRPPERVFVPMWKKRPEMAG